MAGWPGTFRMRSIISKVCDLSPSVCKLSPDFKINYANISIRFIAPYKNRGTGNPSKSHNYNYLHTL